MLLVFSLTEHVAREKYENEGKMITRRFYSYELFIAKRMEIACLTFYFASDVTNNINFDKAKKEKKI